MTSRRSGVMRTGGAVGFGHPTASQPKQLRRTVLLHNEPSYPAKAGIQYAAAYRFHHNGSGILDHPASRMMTAGCGADSYVNHSFTIPRHDMPGLCVNVSPHEKSGRGECRV